MDSIKWIAIVLAALAMGLFVSDLVINLRKRRNTVINIVGLVFLTFSVVCFVLTIVFGDETPQLLNYAWIAFLVGYLVCDVIMAVDIGKTNAQNKRASLQGSDVADENEKR